MYEFGALSLLTEYFVMSGDAEEDSLLGRETEGLIGKLAAIFIDGAEGAYGWDRDDEFNVLATTPAVHEHAEVLGSGDTLCFDFAGEICEHVRPWFGGAIVSR